MMVMDHEYLAVIKLWRRVLIQAFMDAMNQSDKTCDEIARRDALHFLTKPTPELAGICLVCGYRMRDTMDAASNILNGNTQAIRRAIKQLQGR